MGLVVAAVMQLERTRSPPVKRSPSSLVKQVVVCLHHSCQPIVIELQQRMAVEADRVRVTDLGRRMQIAEQVAVVALRFGQADPQQIWRQLLVVAVVVGKAVVVAVAVQQESM